MGLGLSGDEASGLLAAQFQGTSYSASANWIQLHLGDPGAAGTANLCALTDRADASAAFGTDPVVSSGTATITSDGDIGATEWVDPPSSETPTHFSRWTASSGGTFLGSGLLSSGSITAHSPFQLDAGDVSASYSVAT